MNIELARTFLEVVAAGSLARAADRIHVTHSTVTMRIKVLEDIVGRKLLVRSKSGVTMTPAGNRFYHFAETLVRTWQMSKRKMSLAAGFNGILSIGAETALWDDLMFDWACKTRRSRPNIALRCESGTPEFLTERLFQGWLDLCIVYSTQSRTGFAIEKLFDDPLVLVSTDPREMKSWDPEFVEIDWDEGYRTQVEKQWGELDETPAISVSNSNLGIRFIMEFGGSTWIPRRVFETTEFPKKLYHIEGSPVFERTAYLIYSAEEMSERLPHMSMDELRDSLIKHLAGEETIWRPDKPVRRTRS